MWIFDKLFNRKIEGKSSLDGVENLLPLAEKVEYVGEQVKVDADVQVEGFTSKGIANTGGFANIGNVAISGDLDVGGKISIKPSLAIDIPLTTNAGEVDIIFSKASIYEFGMFISGNAIIRNPSESQISVSSITAQFDVPSEYGDKIFDYGGAKVSEEPGSASTRDILTTPAFTGINNIVGGQMKNCYVRHTAKDKMGIELAYSTNIAAGGRNAVTFRTFILF